MTIIEHLEELRRRLLFALVALGMATALSWIFVEPLLAFVMRPVTRLGERVIFLAPTEAFFVRLKVAVLAGVFVSLPVVLYQVWRFVAAGLTDSERRAVRWLLLPAYLLFIGGAAFALAGIVPIGVRFLLSYQTPDLQPMLSIGAYTSFVMAFMLAFGLVFELPVVLVLLAKLGLVTPAGLAAGRRYAIVAIVGVAAVLTPGGDVFSQLLMAIPTYLLYEVSIWIARFVAPRAVAIEQVEGR